MIALGFDSQVRGVFRRTAAPGGGAQQWVRGCAIPFFFLASVSAAPAAFAQTLPSGQGVELTEVLVDTVGCLLYTSPSPRDS